MIGKKQLPKPENWQDFETLCKKLWGEIWACSNTIKKNGRIGQVQFGVDVYGVPKDETAYNGIQCKGKDEYTNSSLSEMEVDREIKKALNFQPKLKQFILATTANKDVKIEQYIRLKDIESRLNGEFEIHLFSWEDIVDLIDENRDTYNWYVNSRQFREYHDVDVLIEGMKEIEVHPQYIRTTKKHLLKEVKENLTDLQKLLQANLANFGISQIPKIKTLQDGLNQRSNIDCRWCKFTINIQNIGNTVIDDYKLALRFEQDKITEIDDLYRSFNPGPLFDAVMVNQVNHERKHEREVFESSQYFNVIEFRPLNNQSLVQKDNKSFEIRVKPKDGASEIKIYWHLMARNHDKRGELKLKVVPQFEDKTVDEYVEYESGLKENEVIIEPKIQQR